MDGWLICTIVLGCVYAIGVLLIVAKGHATDLSRVELVLVALLWPPAFVVFMILWGIETWRWRRVR